MEIIYSVTPQKKTADDIADWQNTHISLFNAE